MSTLINLKSKKYKPATMNNGKRCNTKMRILSFVLYMCFTAGLRAQAIQFAQETVDVGQTTWYEPIKATFYFKNISGHDIQVIDVDPGCGCMEPSWTKGVIHDMGKGSIDITYNAEMLGRFDRIIVVIVKGEPPMFLRMQCKVVSDKVEQQAQPKMEGWNDEPEVVEVEIVEEVKETPKPTTGPIMAIPSNYVSAGEYKANKKLNVKLMIKNEGTELLLINGVRAKSDAILVKDVKVGIPPGKIYTLKFKFDTWKLPAKDEKCEMVIETNDPQKQSYSVFVFCE